MKKNKNKNPLNISQTLVTDIKLLIEQSRHNVALNVNAELTLLYWNIGKRIKTDILNNKRAEYGKRIIANLSFKLTEIYGKGWSEQQLRHCFNLVDSFPNKQILCTLCRELSWSHFRLLMFIDNDLKRDFYIGMCKLEKWSVRILRDRIKSMLYERTAISKKPKQTIKNELKLLKDNQQITPDLVFRDPYFLDFLGLKDTYSEKDLETAIITELQRFIIEFGNDFAFLSRQKRITIDKRDYKIDLLFFHRRLKCLVVIDLKIGEFEAGYKGQMELYLRYLEKYEMLEGENSPVGLILCTGKNKEHIELLQLDESNIKVSEYWTELFPEKLLKEKLHKAIELAQNNLIKK